MNHLKTYVLLAAMTALFGVVGYLIGGPNGMLIALAVAAAMNLFAYWNADKLVLRHFRAQEIDPRHPDPAGGSHGQGRAPIRTAAELRDVVEGKDAFEILECIFEGDPLRIAERCRRRLHAEARLLDPDRVARAWVSQVASSLEELTDGDDLDEWLGQCGDPAIWSVMLEESEAAREIRRLEEALARVDASHREVLLLIGVEGLEQEEVAKILGVSYEALRQRLSRARAKLAAAMERLERTPAKAAQRGTP